MSTQKNAILSPFINANLAFRWVDSKGKTPLIIYSPGTQRKNQSIAEIVT